MVCRDGKKVIIEKRGEAAVITAQPVYGSFIL